MIARFEDFYLDTEAFRLTRNGEELHLARQPLDLLIFLVKLNGKLATREEISTALWGEPDIAGSEHSINTTIRKIRVALGDDPQTPKYIETVVRRGYRFIAPVMIADEPRPLPEPVPVSTPPPAKRFPLTRPATLVAAASLMAFALAAAVWERIEDRPLELTWKPLTGNVHIYWKLASDGKNVFWNEVDTTGCRPVQVPLEGGTDPIPVRSPFPRGSVLDADPSGQLLLIIPETCRGLDFASIQGPLWEINAASGAARRVGDLTGQDAAFSSDGRQIALAQWNRLYLANRDGSGVRQLATLPGNIKSLRWSPDGKLLRFCIVADTTWTFPLWEADTSTGKTRESSPGSRDVALGGDWLPDKSFLFGAFGPVQRDLWQLFPPLWPGSTNRLRRLTNGPLGFAGPITIPGRSELAVVGEHQQGELSHFDFAGHRFQPLLKGISAEMADFSRDGNWVVYVTYPARDLWRSRADGSDALQLTHGPLRAALPRISPDNRQIAFTGDYSGKDLRTWLVPFDGGPPRTATRLATGTAEVAPTWSPDGRKLLMRFDRPGRPNVIQIVDLASGNAEIIPGSEDKFNQRWSPNGKWLVATPHGAKGLFVFDFEHRKWKNLTSMWADYPNWSHNSDFICFATILESGRQAIYRASVPSGQTEEVTTLTEDRYAPDWLYGQWLGIAPDDSPLIAKSANLQQIFLLSIQR